MRRRVIAATVLAIAAAAAIPTSASALTVAPASVDYGSRTVGSPVSSSVTVTTACVIPNPIGGGCLVSESFTPNPAFTGANPGEFSQSNDCGAGISGVDSCAFSVTYNPTASGTHSATLTLGSGGFPIPSARTVALTGTAVAAPVVTPTTPPQLAPKKKCKKKGKKAGVAKKCKKK
jgi:hypothetical protein